MIELTDFERAAGIHLMTGLRDGRVLSHAVVALSGQENHDYHCFEGSTADAGDCFHMSLLKKLGDAGLVRSSDDRKQIVATRAGLQWLAAQTKT